MNPEEKEKLLKEALEEVENLEKAELVGWDVEADLKLARKRVEEYSK